MHSSEETVKYQRIVVALLSLLSLIAVGYILYEAKSILLPFALAIFISYILYPVINTFEKFQIPSFLSILFTLLIGALILAFVVSLISTSIDSFSKEFPKYEPRLTQLTNDVQEFFDIPDDVFTNPSPENEDNLLGRILENFSIPSFLSGVVGSISSVLSNIFLIALILLFMLMSRNQLPQKVNRAFDSKTASKIANIVENVNQQIQKYIITKTLISLVTSGFVMIILALFEVEFVVIWGILTFILNFIPNIGSLIATILPLIIAFLQFEDPMIVFWLAVLLIVVQQVMGNIVEPKWLGKSINLSPLVILFSLIFWGWLWGIIGMFLSVPITVMIKIIFENVEGTKPIAVLMGGAK